jgi:methylenetetrahydrofolate reductase (NADH)
MYVVEHLEKARDPLFSYEIIPPLRGKSAREVFKIVEQVIPFHPPFIDVTSHPAEAAYRELKSGEFRRHVRKKRPGTISLCGIIQNRYNIDTVAHLLCRGFTQEETEDAMIELSYLGIHNVLAVRGDETNYQVSASDSRPSNVFAEDLVRQLNQLKVGSYLEEIQNSDPIEMCIGVGGYPEKHVESPNIKRDIAFLKAKLDAGADYVVTQMYYDNATFFAFVKECRAAGITAPIIPGLKVITSTRQMNTLAKNFHLHIPEELEREIHDNPKHVREIGINWTQKQCEGLLNNGVNCLHFYVMTDARPALRIVKSLNGSMTSAG